MKKFGTSLTGYTKVEVNKFVKEVTQEYETILTNLKTKDQEIQNLNQRLAHYETIEVTLNKALLVAEDAANNIKRIARTESNGLLADAKRNASRIVNDALLKADQIEREAENLKRKVIIFKRKFKQALEEQIIEVDEIDDRL